MSAAVHPGNDERRCSAGAHVMCAEVAKALAGAVHDPAFELDLGALPNARKYVNWLALFGLYPCAGSASVVAVHRVYRAAVCLLMWLTTGLMAVSAVVDLFSDTTVLQWGCLFWMVSMSLMQTYFFLKVRTRDTDTVLLRAWRECAKTESQAIKLNKGLRRMLIMINVVCASNSGILVIAAFSSGVMGQISFVFRGPVDLQWRVFCAVFLVGMAYMSAIWASSFVVFFTPAIAFMLRFKALRKEIAAISEYELGGDQLYFFLQQIMDHVNEINSGLRNVNSCLATLSIMCSPSYLGPIALILLDLVHYDASDLIMNIELMWFVFQFSFMLGILLPAAQVTRDSETLIQPVSVALSNPFRVEAGGDRMQRMMLLGAIEVQLRASFAGFRVGNEVVITFRLLVSVLSALLSFFLLFNRLGNSNQAILS